MDRESLFATLDKELSPRHKRAISHHRQSSFSSLFNFGLSTGTKSGAGSGSGFGLPPVDDSDDESKHNLPSVRAHAPAATARERDHATGTTNSAEFDQGFDRIDGRRRPLMANGMQTR